MKNKLIVIEKPQNHLYQHLQEQVLVAATDWVSVVHLVYLNGFVQSHHHVVSDDAQWKERTVEAPDVLDGLRLAARNGPSWRI